MATAEEVPPGSFSTFMDMVVAGEQLSMNPGDPLPMVPWDPTLCKDNEKPSPSCLARIKRLTLFLDLSFDSILLLSSCLCSCF